jgi:hypothetical protein
VGSASAGDQRKIPIPSADRSIRNGVIHNIVLRHLVAHMLDRGLLARIVGCGVAL